MNLYELCNIHVHAGSLSKIEICYINVMKQAWEYIKFTDICYGGGISHTHTQSDHNVCNANCTLCLHV